VEVGVSPQSLVYDGSSLLLTGASLFFFYETTQFLVGKDYVASVLTLVVGFLLLRVAVEVGKLALVIRRRDRERGEEG
jgi:hypothetical protein